MGNITVNWSLLTRIVLLCLAFTLTACVSSTSSRTTPVSRYAMTHDSPELEVLDTAAIKPIVPVVENRTIAGNKSPYTINGQTYTVMASEEGYAETGMASWYGRKFHGHLTSNGEIYDMFQLSAAHKTMPIPSYLTVTNLDNGKSVVVRVNDRGPFHTGRVVDLSYAAATMLGYADKGTARVKVEALIPQVPIDTAEYEYLQIGAFSNKDSAESLLTKLSDLTSLPVFIFSEGDPVVLHRVRLGPLNETMGIQNLIQRIEEADLGKPFKISL